MGWIGTKEKRRREGRREEAEVARIQNRKDVAKCILRTKRWIIAMQSKNGGWGAFDIDNNYSYLNYIPFADPMNELAFFSLTATTGIGSLFCISK